MSTLCKAIYRSLQPQSMIFFSELQQIIIHFYTNYKRPWIAKAIWHKHRHRDQRNTIENPELNPSLHGQFITMMTIIYNRETTRVIGKIGQRKEGKKEGGREGGKQGEREKIGPLSYIIYKN